MSLIQMPTYIDAIAQYYPSLEASAMGDGSDYEYVIVTNGTKPPKADLDAHILAMTKEKMWRLIQAERDRRKAGGVKIGTNWFHSDDPSRIQQIGLLLMGASMPNNIMWKTMSGSFIQMTPTIAQQIFAATGASDMSIFATAEQHRAQMNASSTPESYDYLTVTPLWPKVYGE